MRSLCCMAAWLHVSQAFGLLAMYLDGYVDRADLCPYLDRVISVHIWIRSLFLCVADCV